MTLDTVSGGTSCEIGDIEPGLTVETSSLLVTSGNADYGIYCKTLFTHIIIHLWHPLPFKAIAPIG